MSVHVSVVIPTRKRPALVGRAVLSALRQTYPELEVIVVVDGPDDETRVSLAQLVDPRLRVVELPATSGGAEARNAGVRAARGRWVAFLDDDDEWLPHKLELQLAEASRSTAALPIVACRIVGRTPRGDYIWPRRMPHEQEPLGDYLFVRNGLFQGEGLIQTSMILAPRALLVQVPFRAGLSQHQDWDWLLHAVSLPEVRVLFVEVPCAVWYIEEARDSVSRGKHWEESLRWLREVRHLLTPRAYAAFEMTIIGAAAARTRDWKAFRLLLSDARRTGALRKTDLALYLGMWLIPPEVRRALRARLSARGQA